MSGDPWLLGLGALGAAGLLARGHWIYVAKRFTTLVPGRAYRSGELSERRLTAAVRRHGIRSVIDLRRNLDRIEREKQVLQKLGVTHTHLAAKQVPQPETLAQFVQILERTERPVLIHCRHGSGRARVFGALYMIEFEGWSAERAARMIPVYARKKRAFVAAHVPLHRPTAR
ncbi:MAG: phosphatase domain-containing putative toxin [Planctomycetota bacterium]